MEDRFRSIGHVCCSSYSTRTDQGRLALRRAIGFLPQAWLIIQHDFALPSFCSPSSEKELLANLEDQQLNLVGLWLSYQSQKGDLFAPRSLARFPKVALGFSYAGDPSNAPTTGFGIRFDLTLFNDNRGPSVPKERHVRSSVTNMPIGSWRGHWNSPQARICESAIRIAEKT
jgi:hypothetical protein